LWDVVTEGGMKITWGDNDAEVWPDMRERKGWRGQWQDAYGTDYVTIIWPGVGNREEMCTLGYRPALQNMFSCRLHDIILYGYTLHNLLQLSITQYFFATQYRNCKQSHNIVTL